MARHLDSQRSSFARAISLGSALLLLWAATSRADSSSQRRLHAHGKPRPAKKARPHKRSPPPRTHHQVEGANAKIPEPHVAPEPEMATRGPTRLDFDDRLIQGQSNKAGAIFLYDRKSLPLRSMVHEPTNFREAIDRDLPQGASR